MAPRLQIRPHRPAEPHPPPRILGFGGADEILNGDLAEFGPQAPIRSGIEPREHLYRTTINPADRTNWSAHTYSPRALPFEVESAEVQIKPEPAKELVPVDAD